MTYSTNTDYVPWCAIVWDEGSVIYIYKDYQLTFDSFPNHNIIKFINKDGREVDNFTDTINGEGFIRQHKNSKY